MGVLDFGKIETSSPPSKVTQNGDGMLTRSSVRCKHHMFHGLKGVKRLKRGNRFSKKSNKKDIFRGVKVFERATL